MRYEINEEKAFELKIWLDDEAEMPTIIQPHWPDGTAWASAEEPQSWAEATIAHASDPDAQFMAGPRPSDPLMPVPSIPTTAEKLMQLGLTVEELKEVLDSIG